MGCDDDYDPETGEIECYPVVNCETGEVEIYDQVFEHHSPTVKFRIPKCLYKEVENNPTGNADQIAKLLFFSSKGLEAKIAEEEVKAQPKNVDKTEKQTSSNVPPINSLIDPVIRYTKNVVNVMLCLWMQQHRTPLKNLRISDIYYQSLLKSVFRNLAPLMRNKHLKRKGLKYGLQCVKRVRVF